MRRLVAGVMAVVGAVLVSVPAVAQEKTDSSTIGPDGTAYVTRVVPVPKTVSPEAQAMLARAASDANVPQTLEQRRTGTDKWQAGAGEVSKKLYPANVTEATMAGVPVRVVTPVSGEKRGRVLINLHGGGFNSDSGSLTETIPLANLTGMKVIAVLYRLAPEHPYPAGLDDAIAVYKEVLKTYKPKNIGIYGTSAGAILTAEVTAKIKQLGLPMPGATGVFSGMGDFARAGDSTAMYALNGLSGYLAPPKHGTDEQRVCWVDGSEGPDSVAGVWGPDGISSDAVHYQRARSVVEWDDDSASRVSARRRGCATGGVRSAAACVLE